MFCILHTLHTLSIYLIDFQTNELVYAAIQTVYARGLFLLFHQILFAAADSAMLKFWHIPKETTKGRDTICLQSRTCNPAKLVVDGCW